MSEKNKSKSLKKTKDKPKSSLEKKETLFEAFRSFIARGNVIELAVGLTVGAAFTKVVTSLVSNLLMPLIGLFLRGESFKELFIPLDGGYYATLADAETAGVAVLKYGQLIADIVDFLIIAIVVFAIIQIVSKVRWKRKTKDDAKE